MKNSFIVVLLLTVAACSKCPKSVPPPTYSMSEQRSAVGQPLSGTDTMRLQMNARVKSVDLATRQVSLLGSRGDTFTIKASDKVRRLDEIKPGDNVVVDYMQGMAFEVRQPTAEELANPYTKTVTGARADASMPPGAGEAETIRSVVTISNIDKAADTVTITMPDGRSQTIKAKYPSNLDRVNVGDKAVVTYNEAIGVNITPAA